MDFNGNVCTGQCGQTEDPWSGGALNGLRKNCCRLNEEKNGPRMSRDSLESANSRDFARNRPRDPEYQKAARQSENYAEMCEHERGGGNACEGTELNFNDNPWPCVSYDPYCDNFGNDCGEAVFEANQNHNVCANCKTEVNLSPQREKKCDENPKHNVSFKRCCESINQMWSKKRRKRSNPDSALKKRTKERKIMDPNHRCTFENCYGNCDTYVVELPGPDYDQCQNCQNMDFDSSDAYLEDCCCSREPKSCPSNVSVHSVRRVHRVCANCTESVKCCSPREPQCDLCASSKHCLQRVHFAKPRHSCCSFCSRKCSPSRASLFVEIGSSVADLHCLKSGQVFRLCNDSSESLGDGLARRESDPVKRNKSDLPKTRSKSKKRADAPERKCSPSCRAQPAIGRSFSDKIECPETDCDAIEKGRDKKARKRKSAHKLSNCSLHQPFSHKASTVCFDTNKTDCWQQCETYERSMWEEIRKGKLWLQDSCKHFLKTAATSINQLVKQTSKGKLFKKCTRKPDKSQGCDDIIPTGCANEGNLSNCLRESVCWTEMITDESNDCNAHCCQNACCSFNEDSNTTGVFQCQKYDHYNYCQTARDGNRHVYPADRDLCEDRERCTGCGIRERGGSNSSGGSQKKRPPSSRDTSSTSASSRATSIPRSQATQRQPTTEASRGRARQRDPVNTTIDSTIQTCVQSTLDPARGTQRSVAYQRRIVQVTQVDEAANQDRRLPTRQPNRALTPGKSAARTKEGPAAGDPTATSQKSGIATADVEVQCEIITQTKVICSPSGTETPTQVDSSCTCNPGAVDDTVEDVTERHSQEDVSQEAIKGSDTDQFRADDTEQPLADDTEQPLADDTEQPLADDTEQPLADDTEQPLAESTGIQSALDVEESPEVGTADDTQPEIAEETLQDDPVIDLMGESEEESTTTDEELEVIDTIKLPDDSTVVAAMDEASTATEPCKTKTTISKVTKDGRSVASVDIQTSSTILTKLLSEFQIGNTRKRILMSIKLQTARDTDTASFSSDSNAAAGPLQVTDTAKRTKKRSNSATSTQKKSKCPANAKSPTSRATKPKGAIDQSQGVNTDSSHRGEQSRRNRSELNTKQDTLGLCGGPCGRDKPLN